MSEANNRDDESDTEIDEEPALPEGFEAKITPEGRVYYVDHVQRKTQWNHPVTNQERQLRPDLPSGWEMRRLDNGTVMYIDNANKRATSMDPRLAKISKKPRESIKRQRDQYDQLALLHISPEPQPPPNSPKHHNFYIDEDSHGIVKNKDFAGYRAIVVGANRGLGLEIARTLAFRNCHVIMACRDVGQAQSVLVSIQNEMPSVKMEAMELDLSSLISVKSFVDRFKAKDIQLNMLFLNAAVFETEYKTSKDNIELMFQVNYLAQFYLARHLIGNLMNATHARIVITSCEAHRGGDLHRSTICAEQFLPDKANFHFLQTYCNTKLCNVLFASELNRRLNNSNTTLVCKSCHPGNMLPTKFFDKWLLYRFLNVFAQKFTKTISQAAATPVLLATIPTEYLKRENFYWNNLMEAQPSDEALDPVLAYRLWEISESILIERTSSFDTFLCNGDRFSSFTKIMTPASSKSASFDYNSGEIPSNLSSNSSTN